MAGGLVASTDSYKVSKVAPPSRLRERRHCWAVKASLRERMWVVKMPLALAATFWLWDWKVAYPVASASSRVRRTSARPISPAAAEAASPKARTSMVRCIALSRRVASALGRRRPAVGVETGVAQVELEVHAPAGLGRDHLPAAPARGQGHAVPP